MNTINIEDFVVDINLFLKKTNDLKKKIAEESDDIDFNLYAKDFFSYIQKVSQVPEDAPFLKHFKKSENTLKQKIVLLSSSKKEESISILAAIQLLLIQEKDYQNSILLKDQENDSASANHNEALSDHLALYTVQTYRNEKDIIEHYSKTKSLLKKIAQDVLYGTLGDQLPEIRQAAFSDEPFYLEWLLKAVIIKSIIYFEETPIELLNSKIIVHLRKILEPLNCSEIELYLAVWQNISSSGSDQYKLFFQNIQNLTSSFYNEKLRPILNLLLHSCRSEVIIRNHFDEQFILFFQKGLDVFIEETKEILDSITDLTQKGIAIHSLLLFAKNREGLFETVAEQNAMDEIKKYSILMACESGIAKNLPQLEDAIMKSAISLKDNFIFKLIPYLVEFKHTQFELAIQTDKFKSSNFLKDLSEDKRNSLITHEFTLLAKRYASREKLNLLLSLYSCIVCTDYSNKEAFNILLPAFQHATTQKERLKLLLVIADTFSNENAEIVSHVVEHVERSLNLTINTSLSRLNWLDWFNKLSQHHGGLNNFYNLYPLLRVFAPYISEEALEATWKNLYETYWKDPLLKNDKILEAIMKCLYKCMSNKEKLLKDLFIMSETNQNLKCFYQVERLKLDEKILPMS